MRVVLLALLAVGLIYFYTLAPSVASQGDSGELVVTAWFLGVNHPPGYPLYTILAHLFTILPWGTVAWRVNLFSAITQLTTLGVFFLIFRKLGGNLWAALGGLFGLALSYTFWLYALVAEVFPLNNLFAAILIYLTLDFGAGKKKLTGKQLFILALVAGLAVFHHQTIVLIFPAVGYYLFPGVRGFFKGWRKDFKKKSAILAACSLAFIVGALPYSLYFWRNWAGPVPGTWTYPADLKGVWSLMIRQNYGTFAITAGVDPALVKLSDKISQVTTFARLVWDDFLPFGIALALAGWMYFAKVQRRVAIFIFIGFFFAGVAFLSYANFDFKDASGTGFEVLERFYLLPELFIGLAIGAGFIFLQNLFQKRMRLSLILVLTVVCYTSLLFISHFKEVNQRDNYLAYNLGKDLLTGLPAGAIYQVNGDLDAFVTAYVRYVDNYQPGVELLTQNQALPDNQFKYLKSVRPDLNWSLPRTASFAGVIDLNFGKANFAANLTVPKLSETYTSSLSGFLVQVKKNDNFESLASWQDRTGGLISSYRLPRQLAEGKPITTGDYSIIKQYISMLQLNGHNCALNQNFDCAERYYLLAGELDPLQVDSIYLLADLYRHENKCSEAETEYLKGIALNNQAPALYQGLVDLSAECWPDSDKARQYQKKLEQENGQSGPDLHSL